MTPLFIATEPFSAADGDKWKGYVEWSGLTQLREVVSLDPLLCPRPLGKIKDEYWPHIVHEDFMLGFFTDFEFLTTQLEKDHRQNLLCVFRNPDEAPNPPSVANFEFLGYDLVDVQGSASALTNCGGFPEVFSNDELSVAGLLTEFRRAKEVQKNLRLVYPNEHHADCHVWAIFRAT